MNAEGTDAPTLTRVVLGAVLCGGASRRMGEDKALLRVGGQPLLKRAAEVLCEVSPAVVLACGVEERYAGLGFERVLDRLPAGGGGGPLSGLEAVLSRAAAADDGTGYVCVLACDMPRVSAPVFEALLARAEARDADVCLLATPEGPEPLLAVYRVSCLGPVRAALAAGERRMISFHQGFGELVVESLDESELPAELGRACARNVNTREDYLAETENDGARPR